MKKHNNTIQNIKMSTQKSSALCTDLNQFIYGVSRRNFQNAPELTKNGIVLLKNFPASRDAVLEYFSIVFHEAVNISLNQQDYESDPSAVGALESASMIGPELCRLGPSWAPFIAPWCIKLLMDIANEKSNHTNSALQASEPIRILLETTTHQLTLLDSEERAKCIDMMLSSVSWSWCVGVVGRVEAKLVCVRALTLRPDHAKLVLAPLAHHPQATTHLRQAILDMFYNSIKPDSPLEKKRTVIPYLLNLASKSDIVLKALTQDLEETLTLEVIRLVSLVCETEHRCPQWETVTAGSLVSLVLRANVHCLLLMMDRARQVPYCRYLTELLLQKLEYECINSDKKIPLLSSALEKADMIREKLLSGNQLERYTLARVLIMICHSHPTELVNTISYMLQYSRNDSTLALLVRIISGTINFHTPEDSQDINMDTNRYQKFITTGVQYGLSESNMADMQIRRCFIEGNIDPGQKTYLHHFCLNVIQLLRWENSNRVSALKGRYISASVESTLYKVGGALSERASLLRARTPCTLSYAHQMSTCHALAELLDRVDMSGSKSPPPSVEVVIKVVHATVYYFFRSLHEKEIMSKLLGVQTACSLLRKLCVHSPLCRSLAVRDLLETAVFREEDLFGSTPLFRTTTGDWPQDTLLMHENQKHGPITQLTQSHTSVFHAGIIGRGVRQYGDQYKHNQIPPFLTMNNELLMGALMSCMDGNSGVVEGATAVSLLLVELISPDVMYNGLPWPVEDFTKQVSIERELYIRGAVESAVPARGVLWRCGTSRPALCFTSALLRALAASLLHRLKALTDRHCNGSEMEKERSALNELVSFMTLGQLLPHPLCHIVQLAPELSASELVQVLRDCLWNYTHDIVPSPDLFTCDNTGLHWRDPATSKPPSTYTDTLRIIIQKKISKLGHLYPILFMNLEKSEC